MPHWVATEEDRQEARRRLLEGLIRGDDPSDIAATVLDLHRQRNTFPGEVYMELAADALQVAGITRQAPISYNGLRDHHLPELRFRGKENRKIQFAMLTAAALRGGLEPDLLDEVIWWGTDDYWEYALFAAVALIRAAANQRGMSVADLATDLARHHHLDLA